MAILGKLGKGALLAAGLAVIATTASAYIARNRLVAKADPSRAGVFEVFQKSPAGNGDYWCAAGDFVLGGMQERSVSRIYLLRPMGPSNIVKGRKSIAFTVVPYPEVENGPKPGDGGNYSVSIKKVGFNLQAAHARSFCHSSRKRMRGLGF